MDYQTFVSGKLQFVAPSGMESVPELHPTLYPHQRDLTRWALQRGRCALFADTGLGIPYAQILGQKGGDRVAEAALRSAITTCPGVSALLDFALTLDRARHAVVTFRARTVDGDALRAVNDASGFRWERV